MGDGKTPSARIGVCCPACAHFTTFDRGHKGEMPCGKCGRPMGMSGMAP